jgi:VCBS repeat protein/FG-GAP repeat protein
MRRGRALLAALAVAGAAATAAYAAGGTFSEADARVLQQWQGSQPGSNFGWAASALGQSDAKHGADLIVGEPFSPGGSAYVYESRSGRLIHRFDGAAGDWLGFAIADAGDVNGDRGNDILVGAPANGAGHVDLYSGRTGRLMHRFVGETEGDFFGWAVSSAGDVDRDGRPDILIGASVFSQDVRPGFAYIYSGRTFALIRKLTGDANGDEFGSGAGWTPDVNNDGVPDQIVGARDAGDGARGKVYVYSGLTGARLLTIDAAPQGEQFGSFFVAGFGDVNRDGTPDFYAADYADDTNGHDAGRAAVYSGSDGTAIHVWLGATPDAGLGPGRGAGDVDGDGIADVIVGSYSSSEGADQAGKADVFSGEDGSHLRSITSTTPLENFGFDAVGVGDANGDGLPDLLVTAATGERVYLIAGNGTQ